MSLIKTVEVPATAVGALPVAEAPLAPVRLLAQAIDARLFTAPVGCESEPCPGPCWADCGQVGWPQVFPLAAAVQAAWAAAWHD